MSTFAHFVHQQLGGRLQERPNVSQDKADLSEDFEIHGLPRPDDAHLKVDTVVREHYEPKKFWPEPLGTEVYALYGDKDYLLSWTWDKATERLLITVKKQ